MIVVSSFKLLKNCNSPHIAIGKFHLLILYFPLYIIYFLPSSFKHYTFHVAFLFIINAFKH